MNHEVEIEVDRKYAARVFALMNHRFHSHPVSCYGSRASSVSVITIRGADIDEVYDELEEEAVSIRHVKTRQW